MKIVITQEDVKNSHGYMTSKHCPLAIVMQRELNIPNIFTGGEMIGVHNNGINEYIGEINPPFRYADFIDLQEGEIKEFVTEYTPNRLI